MAMENESLIELKNIGVSFDGEQILHNLNLTMRRRRTCHAAGAFRLWKNDYAQADRRVFAAEDCGDVLFAGKRVNEIPPHKRQVNTIFQKYALFPHLNVYENVAFGMRIRKSSRKQKSKKTVMKCWSLLI